MVYYSLNFIRNWTFDVNDCSFRWIFLINSINNSGHIHCSISLSEYMSLISFECDSVWIWLSSLHSSYKFSLLLNPKMESRNIKLFQCVKKSFGLMGINVSHSNRNCAMNWRILLCYVPVTLFFISSTAYMVLKANSVLEFNDSFFVNMTTFLNICSISISIGKMPSILSVIKKLEKSIKKSEQKPYLFLKTIFWIEKISLFVPKI